MMYVKENKRKTYLICGFISMLLCGVSDCLLSYMGDGEPYVLGGMVSANIVDEPLWYYMVSFVIGIIAAIGYYLASRAACSYISDKIDISISKRAALLAGASANMIEKYFTESALIPFMVGTLWQTTADLIAGIAFIIMVCKRQVAISKGWITMGPLVLYVICQLLGKLLPQITGNDIFAHITGGGESWGLAFMFLAFCFACRKKADNTK